MHLPIHTSCLWTVFCISCHSEQPGCYNCMYYNVNYDYIFLLKNTIFRYRCLLNLLSLYYRRGNWKWLHKLHIYLLTRPVSKIFSRVPFCMISNEHCSYGTIHISGNPYRRLSGLRTLTSAPKLHVYHYRHLKDRLSVVSAMKGLRACLLLRPFRYLFVTRTSRERKPNVHLWQYQEPATLRLAQGYRQNHRGGLYLGRKLTTAVCCIQGSTLRLLYFIVTWLFL